MELVGTLRNIAKMIPTIIGTIRPAAERTMPTTAPRFMRSANRLTPTIVGIRTFFMVDPPIMLILSPYTNL
jgi:hypothetical protein